jgi:WD40 repeat protein
MTRSLRWVRWIAIALGAVGLLLTVAVLFNPFSPLSGLEPGRMAMVLAIFVLAGPPWMLPLAILARWWPRASGRLLLSGAVSAVVLTGHPWGLMYASDALYTDVHLVVPMVALVTAGIGAGLMLTAAPRRRWSDVTVTVGVAFAITAISATAIGLVDASTPWRTEHPVAFLSFAPDGRSLIAGSRENSHPGTSVVDVSTGAVTALALGSSHQSVSPDGTTLSTVDYESTRLWDVRTFQERRNMARPDPLSGIAVSRNAIAMIRHDGLLIVDPISGARRQHYKDDRRNTWLAISPDGLYIAAGAADVSTKIWDTRSGSVRVLARSAGEEVWAAQFSPDGSVLVLFGGANIGAAQSRPFLRTHRIADSRDVARFEDSHPPWPWDSPWFSPDGRMLVTVRDVPNERGGPPASLFSLHDTSTWRELTTVRSDGLALAWSPDGRTVAVVVFVLNEGDRLQVRSVGDGGLVRDLGRIALYPAVALAFSPDGRRIAVGGPGDRLRGTQRGRVQLFQMP